MAKSLIELVEEAAKARGDAFVPRDYIVEALEKIERAEIEVPQYTTGRPALKGVYEVALRIYKMQTKK
jgi:hypothetical protein